jgi:hypothetical protein
MIEPDNLTALQLRPARPGLEGVSFRAHNSAAAPQSIVLVLVLVVVLELSV